MSAPPRGTPFDPSSGKHFAILKCPVCLAEPNPIGVEMVCAPVAAHGPRPHEQHEQIADTVSYVYNCPRCRFSFNYPTRLLA